MTRKLIIAAVVVVVLVGGIYALSKADIGMKNPWLDGQLEKAELGDLVIPVTATGTVEPRRLIEIKCKASGQVKEINVVEGQMVTANEDEEAVPGTLLVKLDPIDERRNLETAEANRDRAESVLAKAKITRENYEHDLPLLTELAKARLEDAEAKLEKAEFDYNRIRGFAEKAVSTPSEEVTYRTSCRAAKANRDMAATELRRAESNQDILVRSAQEDENQAEATSKQAQKQYEEADLRLKETEVHAASDGMVYSILVCEGQMIQSGTMSLMGGTPLMFLADTSAMFVTAQVDEADIGKIRDIASDRARPGYTEKLSEEKLLKEAQRILDGTPDKAVRVEVDAYRGEVYEGVIEQILPEPVRSGGAVAFRVRVRLIGKLDDDGNVDTEGKDLTKLLGLQADLTFTTQKKQGVLRVKNEALHSEGRDCFVYVPLPGKPREEEKVSVNIGITDGTWTEITSGLNDGDEVYIKRPIRTEKEKKAAEE
ncbi:MAG: hypothetical protein JXQ75_10270 [Phycisphaerae bacterium]|nr:hypothetical protein [Phycisphaerae bacterium]